MGLAHLARRKASYVFTQILIILLCSLVCCLMYFNNAGAIEINHIISFYFALFVMIIAFELPPVFFMFAVLLQAVSYFTAGK